MEIKIETVYRENYGAHNWDGKGECPQHWKNKGGDTYVVELSTDQAIKLASNGLIGAFVEQVIEENKLNHCDDYSEMGVVDWFVVSENDSPILSEEPRLYPEPTKLDATGALAIMAEMI